MLEKLKKIAPTLPQFATHKAKPVVSVLNQYSAYRISGDDAETFLQGQLSNDVKQLIDGHHGQLTSYCTPKGRMLAIFYLVRLANDYIAIMPSAIAETVFQRLQMFIMRSKVEINALVDNCSLLGLHQADHCWHAQHAEQPMPCNCLVLVLLHSQCYRWPVQSPHQIGWH